MRTQLTVAALLMVASIACADDAKPVPASPNPPAAEQAEAQDPPTSCLTTTGSRIAPKPGKCLDVAGQTYSARELEFSGATNAGDALRMASPAVGGR